MGINVFMQALGEFCNSSKHRFYGFWNYKRAQSTPIEVLILRIKMKQRSYTVTPFHPHPLLVVDTTNATLTEIIVNIVMYLTYFSLSV